MLTIMQNVLLTVFRAAGNMGLAPRGLAVDPRSGHVFVSCTCSHRYYSLSRMVLRGPLYECECVRVRECVCVPVRIQVLRQNPGRMLTHLVRTIGCRGVGKAFVCLCVLHACVCVRVVVNLSHCENVNPGDFQYPLGICSNRG